VKKKRTKWIVVGIVLILVAVAGSSLINNRGTIYARETARNGSITTYYNFSGALEVNQSVTLTAAASDTVAEVYVQANTLVAKNARLMRMSDGTVYKADIGGEVTSINVMAGSVVTAGDVLLEVMDLSSMKVTFKVDEYDVSAVTLGKMAEITLDGSGTTIEGAVTSINKRATQSGDLSYYTATVDLTDYELPADAMPGMQVTAKLLNKQVDNAVLLPMDAISFTSQNSPYVLMQDGKDVKRVDIRVGINDGDMVEITAGLANGDTVLYMPTATESFQMGMGGARNYAQ